MRERNRIGSISSVGRNRLPGEKNSIPRRDVFELEDNSGINRSFHKKKNGSVQVKRPRAGPTRRRSLLGGFRRWDKTFRGIGFKAGSNDERPDGGTGSLKLEISYIFVSTSSSIRAKCSKVK